MADPAPIALIERTTVRKVSRRLLPLLFLLFVAAFLDRTNVGLASLQMNHDLGLSAAVYGFGAGIFFVGYALFEVPSNLILARVGARKWLARIAITWGILACAMMFVRGPRSFYAIRFLLGLAEAGYFPGIIYYLSEWFPERQRARAISRFMIGVPLSGVIGGPAGGALLSLSGRLGLAGWQWLFLVEGIPAVVVGVIAFFFLTSRPAEAAWLEPDERAWLSERLEAERRARAGTSQTSFLRALTKGAVWGLAVIYFLAIAAELGPVFFGPVLVRDALHLGNSGVGLVMGGLGVLGVIAMLLNGAHSDGSGERVMHAVLPMGLVAVGFVVSAAIRQPAFMIVGLALIAVGINAFLPVFWCVPTALLEGTAAAGGIALINSIGNLGGFVAPALLGSGKESSGSYAGGLVVLAAFALASGLLILRFRRT